MSTPRTDAAIEQAGLSAIRDHGGSPIAYRLGYMEAFARELERDLEKALRGIDQLRRPLSEMVKPGTVEPIERELIQDMAKRALAATNQIHEFHK